MNTKTCLLLATITGLGSATAAGCSNASDADDEAKELIVRSREANAALMRGDAARWSALLPLGDDFTLMSPFGGPPSRGIPSGERVQAIGAFFKNGTLEQEVVESYQSNDMIALAVIERAIVEAGGLPSQEWALRVTLVYRRDGATWRLVHRHADPLVAPVSVPQAALLARGERTPGG